MNYQPHQQRVVDEKADLDERLSKLRIFLAAPMFGSLTHHEQRLLIRQADVMTELSRILEQRILTFA